MDGAVDRHRNLSARDAPFTNGFYGSDCGIRVGRSNNGDNPQFLDALNHFSAVHVTILIHDGGRRRNDSLQEGE
jgi:hypothetical protein